MTAAARGLVLVVEDEAAIAEVIALYLRRDGFGVQIESDGEAGLVAWRRLHPVAVILDIGLPGRDGADICRTMRAAGDWTPVLFVTARDDEVDRLLGLELGADDYITKPFSPRELAARVRAVLRRKSGTPQAAMSLYKGTHLVADFDAVSVTVDGDPVRLTRREFDLLRCLVENRNRVLSRDRLLTRVWGYNESIETRSVDVHIGRLRTKLGSAGKQIETVVGIGYRFAE